MPKIFGLELSVAKDNTAKSALNMVLAALFGIFALVFYPQWPYWLSSGMTTEYLLRAVWQALHGDVSFFLARAKNLASNLPYAFTESKQIISNDLEALRRSLNT